MRIYVKVIPQSLKNEVMKISEREYRIRLSAPPVNGAANRKLIEILASYFNISKSLIQIVGGKSARKKIVDIRND